MATSFIRKTIAGAALTGFALAGTAGIASAETGEPAPGRPTQEQRCERFERVWDRLVALDARLHERYHKLGELRDRAVAEGKTELAERITDHMHDLRNGHEVVVLRLKNLHDRAADACDVPSLPADAPLA